MGELNSRNFIQLLMFIRYRLLSGHKIYGLDLAQTQFQAFGYSHKFPVKLYPAFNVEYVVTTVYVIGKQAKYCGMTMWYLLSVQNGFSESWRAEELIKRVRIPTLTSLLVKKGHSPAEVTYQTKAPQKQNDSKGITAHFYSLHCYPIIHQGKHRLPVVRSRWGIHHPSSSK